MSAERQGCLGFLFRFFGSGDDEQTHPYKIIERFMSKAELSFYHVLRLAVGDHAHICPKVSLGDLFAVTQKPEMPHRNRIDRKHVDFLICDPQTLQPLVGIELDDSSHQRSDRQKRDDFVNAVFRTAGLPLLHFPVRQAYTIDEISGRVRLALTGGNSSNAQSSPAPPPQAAILPRQLKSSSCTGNPIRARSTVTLP
jgi:hypothetical protein